VDILAQLRSWTLTPLATATANQTACHDKVGQGSNECGPGLGNGSGEVEWCEREGRFSNRIPMNANQKSCGGKTQRLYDAYPSLSTAYFSPNQFVILAPHGCSGYTWRVDLNDVLQGVSHGKKGTASSH
jgi:hypothetical protein